MIPRSDHKDTLAPEGPNKEDSAEVTVGLWEKYPIENKAGQDKKKLSKFILFCLQNMVSCQQVENTIVPLPSRLLPPQKEKGIS